MHVRPFLSNKKLYLRNPKSIRPWQHVFEPLDGYMLLAEKLYKKKGKLITESWNFGPKEKKHITVNCCFSHPKATYPSHSEMFHGRM